MTEFFSPLIQFLQSNPWLGLFTTLLVYYLAHVLYQKSGQQPLLHPVLTSIIVIIACLVAAGFEYQQYMVGGQLIHFFLGPATVALAYPLYQNLNLVKQMWLPILVTVVVGVLIGATSAVGLAQMLDASHATQMSLAPKSVTTPVAIVVSEQLGGIQALTAGFVIITGVVGAMCGSLIFKWLGIDDPKIKGIAMGVSAHGVGTARALQIHPQMGAFSGLGMALSAMLIAFILPPWMHFLGWA
jgi:predicted murein hydrolase (TIGR00659 family)